MVLIKKITASDSGTIDFKDGTNSVVMDDTYKEYIFHWSDIHPATDGAKLGFQFNVAGGADFNETLIGSYWRSYHDEGDSGTGVGYVTSEESDGTGYTILDGGVGNDNDQCTSGKVHVWDPSNTSHVTHYTVETTHYDVNNFNANVFVNGYVTATAAVDEISFKFSSGNIGSGTIRMYGVK